VISITVLFFVVNYFLSFSFFSTAPRRDFSCGCGKKEIKEEGAGKDAAAISPGGWQAAAQPLCASSSGGTLS
jgi:hypothetical protein